MTGFIVRRILSSILVVVLTSMFVFVLFFKGMGTSPAVNYCDSIHQGRCSPATLASIEHQMGYDRSVAANYAIWAKGIFTGRDVYLDGKEYPCPAPCLGVSEMTNNTVWHDLKQKYPATITVAVGGASIYLTFGVLMGAFAARWRGSAGDRRRTPGRRVARGERRGLPRSRPPPSGCRAPGRCASPGRRSLRGWRRGSSGSWPWAPP